MKRRLLLIGWDAADWKIINPLLDSGQMPALERLVNNGVIANLATLDPPVSPMLWTSIATGMKADKHGILGFTEPDNINGGIRPVNVTSRKVKAFWNILHNQGKKCNIIGWWPSHPAESINGAMVSNLFHKSSSTPGETWNRPENSVYPISLIPEIADLRVHPEEITAAHIGPFITDISKFNIKTDPHLPAIAKILAEAASIQAIATHLIKQSDWDITAVYFDSIDHLCHGFMKFASPRMEGVPEDLYELLHNVVNSGYKFHDMMLQRLMDLAGENTTILLVSDHGFHSGSQRPKSLPDFPASPVLEHNPYGIFCISGPGIKKDERIFGASLLDITPTILKLFNLPSGRDMDGKILSSIFENYEEQTQATNYELQNKNYINSWEAVPGDFGNFNKGHTTNIEEAETINRLIQLGYIDNPGENKIKASQKAVDEAHYNLSRVYFSSKKFNEAIEILESLYLKNNQDIRYNLDLALCYLQLDRLTDAENIINNLRRIQNNALPNIDFLQGMLLIKKKQYKKGLQLFKNAEKSNPLLPDIYIEIGKTYLQIGKYSEAKNIFNKAIKIDDNNAAARHGLAVTYLRLKSYDKAIQNALSAIGLLYHFPVAHYHLGEALYMSGRIEDAAKAFEVCLKLSPDFTKAQQWLDKINIVHSPQSTVHKLRAIVHSPQSTVSDERRAKSEKQTTVCIPQSGLQTPNSELLTNNSEIIIVSGIPRSGTSMMMKMLASGGIQVLTDNLRKPDINNPEGFYEYSPVKSLAKDNSWLHQAINKALKVVAHQLYHLPSDYNYKIIFMERDLNEIIRSQQKMLNQNPDVLPLSLLNSFKKEIHNVELWANKEPNVEIIYINYNHVINAPDIQIDKIIQFLGKELDKVSMSNSIKHELYRNKITI